MTDTIRIKDGYDPVNSHLEITEDQLQARIRWVELLRAGRYRKLKEKLATASTKSRCCLGVACDFDVIKAPIQHRIEFEGRIGFTVFDDSIFSLPVVAQMALGFTSGSPHVTMYVKGKKSTTVSLDALNDASPGDMEGHPFLNKNWSHRKIADLIEETYIKPWVYDE